MHNENTDTFFCGFSKLRVAPVAYMIRSGGAAWHYVCLTTSLSDIKSASLSHSPFRTAWSKNPGNLRVAQKYRLSFILLWDSISKKNLLSYCLFLWYTVSMKFIWSIYLLQVQNENPNPEYIKQIYPLRLLPIDAKSTLSFYNTVAAATAAAALYFCKSHFWTFLSVDLIL